MEEDDPYLDGPEDISEFDKPIADTRAAFALRFIMQYKDIEKN